MALCSCQEELDVNIYGDGQKRVSVTLNLNVREEEHGMSDMEDAETKSILDEDIPIIKDVRILQFDGQKKMIHSVYIEDYDSAPGEIELIESTGEDFIAVLANCADKSLTFPLGITLDDFLSATRIINDSSDLFGSVPAPGESDGAFRYPMLNGSDYLKIEEGLECNIELKRNIARIDITVNNLAAGDGSTEGNIMIESIVLKEIPNANRYMTNTNSFPTDNYPPDNILKTINYPHVAWENGDTRGGSTESRHFRFYVPVNLRGDICNEDPKLKPILAPGHATRCVIYAKYLEEGSWNDVRYTFVLGSDLTGNCMIEPNKNYSYTFDIKSKGDRATDGRVEDFGVIDFRDRERANCYLINPAPADGAPMRFRFPVDRVKTFWHEYEDNDLYAMTGHSEGAEWEVDVLWSDFKPDGNNFKFTKKTGLGNDDYFEVEIGPAVEGNMVIRLYRVDNKATTIWSWHLWITDYKADEAELLTPREGKFVYGVTSGTVHRYNNKSFTDGINKDSFIMDRNLGSFTTSFINNFDRGILFYQFGRKDPIPGRAVLYDASGTASPAVAYIASDKTNEAGDGRNVPYSIYYPLTFIGGGNTWTKSDIYSASADYAWLDPKVSIKDTDTKGKSIFDPCPPGWCIPRKETWEDFSKSRNANKDNGRYYYPDDYTQDMIFYPYNGYKNYNSDLIWSKSYGSVWSCSSLLVNTASSFSEDRGIKTIGYSVRCIHE